MLRVYEENGSSLRTHHLIIILKKKEDSFKTKSLVLSLRKIFIVK